MPPKPKETASKKPIPQILRPRIGNSSLNYIPDDALKGFRERIETGIPWTLTEDAARYHKTKCLRKDIPTLKFSDALQYKINRSILKAFLDESSSFTLKDRWNILLSMTVWDNEKFANEEGKICFKSDNSLTDNMIQLIKRAVQHNDIDFLKRELKMVSLLRVNDCEMTELDKSLKKFKNLSTLNLCGNFIGDLNASFLPNNLRILELQNNRISNVESFAEHLPSSLYYLGLARNHLNDESITGLSKIPHNLTVVDLSDNAIYDLELVLNALTTASSLVSLQLAGNPCSHKYYADTSNYTRMDTMCAAYARTTFSRLPRLQWLDNREILPTDRPAELYEPHADDLRSTYFTFTVFRIMSVPQPPKPEKGAITAFHVELELPLLDSTRRKFLMYRNNESLVEMLPPQEDAEWPPTKQVLLFAESKIDPSKVRASSSIYQSDIYNHLTSKNSREICHFTTFESNRIQWNKIMNFQEPTVKIFCPNLLSVRDTFRTVVTVKLVYTVTIMGKQSKSERKSAQNLKPGEQRVVLATVKCALKRPDWSQPSQHFHWDDSLATDDAIHWGDGDLSVLQYTLAAVKSPKGKPDKDPGSTKQFPPEHLTCHFGFGIDTIRS